MPYPLLCDPSREVLEAYGAYGEKKLYGKTVTGVIRSTFVIDEKGTWRRRCTASRPPATSPSCAATSASTDLVLTLRGREMAILCARGRSPTGRRHTV